jgi:hypothetical protein
MEDASGIEGEWRSELPGAPETRAALLVLIGRTYMPFMAANAAAAGAGQKAFEVEILGRPYRRAPFGYQAKCYADVRRRWAELPTDARAALQAPMAESGCLGYLQ